jgi:uncharacterized membrane protein YqgA involved in biofilm formation
MKKIISYLRNIFSFNNIEEITTEIENKTKDVVNLSTTFVTNEVLKVEELVKIEAAVEAVAKVEAAVETVEAAVETVAAVAAAVAAAVTAVETVAAVAAAVETVAKVEEVKPIVENEVKPKSTYRRPKKKNSTKK